MKKHTFMQKLSPLQFCRTGYFFVGAVNKRSFSITLALKSTDNCACDDVLIRCEVFSAPVVAEIESKRNYFCKKTCHSHEKFFTRGKD